MERMLNLEKLSRHKILDTLIQIPSFTKVECRKEFYLKIFDLSNVSLENKCNDVIAFKTYQIFQIKAFSGSPHIWCVFYKWDVYIT